MPFGWSARQIFNSEGKLDPNTDFSPIYKFDEKRIGESEMIKLLTELKKGEKLSKLTVIPGSISIKLGLMEVTTPSKYDFLFSYVSLYLSEEISQSFF